MSKEPVTGRTSDDIRGDLGAIVRGDSGAERRLAGLQIEATLLLVEAIDRLGKHAEETAKNLDYLTDHLNEIGRP